MRKYGFIFILAVILILSTTNTASESENTHEEYLVESPHQTFIESYTSHGNIEIDNDTDFDDTALAEGWDGSGNSTHPYIIEGYNITYSGECIRIMSTTRYFIIRDCWLQGSGFGAGLYTISAPNAQFENVTVLQKGTGFYSGETDTLVMSECKADSCETGFSFIYSDNMELSELETTDIGYYGIYFEGCNSVTLDTVSVSGPGDTGMAIWRSNYMEVTNIEVSDFTYEGVRILDSDFCTLENATVYACGDNLHAGFNCTNANYFTVTNITTWDITQGFWIEDCYQPLIQDSYIHHGYQTGINVDGANNLIIRRTQVESNMYYGIGLHSVVNGLLEYIECTYNNWNALFIEYSPDLTIQSCEFANSGSSPMHSEVYVDLSDNLLIYNTSIGYNQNYNGLEIESCEYADITQCLINNNSEYGIRILDSSHCSLDDCDISFNGDNGIMIESTDTTVVSRCQMYNNSFFGLKTWLADEVEISRCDIYWNLYDGLYIQNTNHTLVYVCDLWENGGGDCEITLDHAIDLTIVGSTLIGNRDTQGIYGTWSSYVTITGNTISGNFDDGLNIQNCNYTTVTNNIISNNGGTGLYMWECDFSTITNNAITDNEGPGIYISACLNMTVSSNTIADNRGHGIHCLDSLNLVINYNDIFNNGWKDLDNPKSGIYMSNCNYGEFHSNTIYNNTIHGMQLLFSENCSIWDNDIYGNLGMSGAGCGIYLYTAHGAVIIGNTIYDNVDNGIYSLATDNCDIINNNIYGNDYAGLYILFANSWTIQENVIWNQISENGIHLFECADFEIDGNDLFSNEYDGIAIYQSERCNITNNFVYNNGAKGIHIATSENMLVMGNIIFDNFDGIFLDEVNATWIFYNDLVLNYRDTWEMQSTGINYWDDGISMGNWYWGIPRDLASYAIWNGTDYVNADSYPMTSMWIDNATMSSYELASTGNLVTWTAYAHNPDYYEVYDGTTLLGTGPWTGSNIIFDVDGLAVGVHDLEIIIYHISGHNLTASVSVTVEDTTPPSWTSTPEDQTITVDETLSYQLLATDYSGLGTWSVNNTLFSITDGLLTNASALEIGDYRLRITVEDIYGNELSVDIWVHVLESTTSDTGGGGLPPETMLLLVLGAGGAAVVIIIIVVVIKKKST